MPKKSNKPLLLRKKVLKALRELKPTHTYKEISDKIGVPVSNIKRIYSLYCETIEKTPKAKKRIFGLVVNKQRNPIDFCNKLIELKNKGLSFKEIGKELSVSEAKALTIYYRLINEQKEDLEETNKWLDEKLVSKYTAAGNYNLTPLYFIKTYNVTSSTAKSICARLKKIGEKRV